MGASHKLQTDAQRYRFVVLRKSAAGKLGEREGEWGNCPRSPQVYPDFHFVPGQGMTWEAPSFRFNLT
jgi:hypothetical protein